MKIYPRFFLLLIFIGGMLFAACQSVPADEADGTAFPVTSTQSPPQDAPTAQDTEAPTATEFPTLAPTETPVEIVQDTCVDCHTDKQRLIDTAFPEEVVESENEGEG